MLPGGLMAHTAMVEEAECFTLVTIHPGGSLGVEVMHPPETERLPAILMASGVSILLSPSIPPAPSDFWQCSIRIFTGCAERAGDMLAEYRNGFMAEA